jgi:hypothetical protein
MAMVKNCAKRTGNSHPKIDMIYGVDFALLFLGVKSAKERRRLKKKHDKKYSLSEG